MVLIASAAITYIVGTWKITLAIGFGLMVTGGVLSRIRATGNPFSVSYPRPTQFEGSVAAVGVSLILGAGIGVVAQTLFLGYA